MLVYALTFLSDNATKHANQAMERLYKNMAAVLLPEVDRRYENKYNYCF